MGPEDEIFNSSEALRFEEFMRERKRIVDAIIAMGTDPQEANEAGDKIMKECREQEALVNELLELPIIKNNYTYDGTVIKLREGTGFCRCKDGIRLMQSVRPKDYTDYENNKFDLGKVLRTLEVDRQHLVGMLKIAKTGRTPHDDVEDIMREIRRKENDELDKLIDSAKDIDDDDLEE